MRDVIILLVQLISMLARLLGPGGSVAAESFSRFRNPLVLTQIVAATVSVVASRSTATV